MKFERSARLGIELPSLENEWSGYSLEEQEKILQKWETVRGAIPDKIKKLEQEINCKQAALDAEENFDASCKLNTEISDLASIINDLWIWFRTSPSIADQTKKNRKHF